MSEVHIKRKVTLKEKSSSMPSATKSHKNSKLLVWLLLIVLIGIAVIVYSIFACGDKNKKMIAPVTAKDTIASQVTHPENQVDSNSLSTNNSTSTAQSSTAPEPQSVKPTKRSEPTAAPSKTTTANSHKFNHVSEPKHTQASTSVPFCSGNEAVEAVAKKVIRGDFGNGAERRSALGDRYTEIQSKVNQYYREKNM